jgi:hypothetical protein
VNTIDPVISSKTHDLEISENFPYAIFRLQQNQHHQQPGRQDGPEKYRSRLLWHEHTMAHHNEQRTYNTKLYPSHPSYITFIYKLAPSRSSWRTLIYLITNLEVVQRHSQRLVCYVQLRWQRNMPWKKPKKDNKENPKNSDSTQVQKWHVQNTMGYVVADTSWRVNWGYKSGCGVLEWPYSS